MKKCYFMYIFFGLFFTGFLSVEDDFNSYLLDHYNIDTTFIVPINDSVFFIYDDLIEIKILKIENEDSIIYLKTIIKNKSMYNFYIDTLNLDQYIDKNIHTFLYGPDLSCYLPLFFLSLTPSSHIIINNIKVNKYSIDTVSLGLFGCRDIHKLKKLTRGQLDTTYSNKEPVYRLRYNCENLPVKGVFYLSISNVPIKEMKGNVKIRLIDL